MSEDNIMYEYWTQGSRDEVEGLTTSVVQVDTKGNIVAAYGNPATQYKARKITKSVYDALQAEMKSATMLGLAGGLISPKVQKELKETVKSAKAKKIEKRDSLVRRTTSKIEKMIDAGIIFFEPSELSPPSSTSSSDADIDFYLDVSDEFSVRLIAPMFTEQEVNDITDRFIRDYKQKRMDKKSKGEA